MLLSPDEYNGLNKIASATKMDCWFYIDTIDGSDVVADLEEGVSYDIAQGVMQLMEGMVEPLTDPFYKLTENEISALQNLFDRVSKSDETDVIYTHDEAMFLVEMFEDILSKYSIKIPSPEDEERDPDNSAGLYGTTYSDLLDGIEERLITLIERSCRPHELVKYEFSGNV